MLKKFLRNIITYVNKTGKKIYLSVLYGLGKAMAIADLIKRTCKSLGENNKPTYVVMAIAAVKGICRPAFTMMDKTENPETKKYTALREGLTEAIAIPAYWGCGELAGKLAKKAFNNDKALANRAEKNLMFIGVCTAALFVIPALCSIAIKPIMHKIGLKAPDGHKDKNIPPAPAQANTTAILKQSVSFNNSIYPRMSTFTSRPQTGLRVGGL